MDVANLLPIQTVLKTFCSKRMIYVLYSVSQASTGPCFEENVYSTSLTRFIYLPEYYQYLLFGEAGTK